MACRALIRVLKISGLGFFGTNLNSHSLQNKPKKHGTGVFCFCFFGQPQPPNFLTTNTHGVVPNDHPYSLAVKNPLLSSQMPKHTKGIWDWAARFLRQMCVSLLLRAKSFLSQTKDTSTQKFRASFEATT